MNCLKCERELFIDRQDSAGAFWYTCLNPRCSEYRVAFNPSSDAKTEASIGAKEFDTVEDTTPSEEPNITD